MLLRVLGLIVAGFLLIVVAIAAPPLALVVIALAFFFRPGRKSKHRQGPPRTGRPKSRRAAAGRRQPPARRPAARPRSARARRLIMWSAGGLLALAVIPALAREAPLVLGAAAVLAIVSLVVRPRRRMQQSPGWTHPVPASRLTYPSTVAIGTAFELEMVDLLTRQGYRRVRHTGQTGDAGVDIIAEDRRGGTYLVQCKCLAASGRVGSGDVQKLIGAVAHRGAAGGILITTAGFTAQARHLARSGQVPVTLIDGATLDRLERGVGSLAA